MTGFKRGIFFDDPTPTAVRGHLVDRMRALDNKEAGIWLVGAGSSVRSSAALDTGGSTAPGASDAYGISISGHRTRLLGNDVSETTSSTGSAYGLRVEAGVGAVVRKNRVKGGTHGIAFVGATDALAQQNRITEADQGIVYDAASSGAYRDNLTSGVTAPYTGGTDAGNNQ